MTTPKDLPRGLRGLWKVQYEPREKAMLERVSPETRRKWNKLRYARKMEIIDNFQMRGEFD